MPFFDHASNTDASQSIFNDVRRDQNTFNVYITLDSAPEQTQHLLRSLGVVLPVPDEGSEISTRGTVFRPTHRSAATSSRDIAGRLIVEIVQSLESDAADQFRDLKEDLNILKQVLDLTGLAIEAYEHTSVGSTLGKAIDRETERCLEVLRELLNAIRAYQRSLRSTSINFLWGRVLGSAYTSDELAIWREKLTACEKSLAECLQLLDSYVLRCFHLLAFLKGHVL